MGQRDATALQGEGGSALTVESLPLIWSPQQRICFHPLLYSTTYSLNTKIIKEASHPILLSLDLISSQESCDHCSRASLRIRNSSYTYYIWNSSWALWREEEISMSILLKGIRYLSNIDGRDKKLKGHRCKRAKLWWITTKLQWASWRYYPIQAMHHRMPCSRPPLMAHYANHELEDGKGQQFVMLHGHQSAYFCHQ